MLKRMAGRGNQECKNELDDNLDFLRAANVDVGVGLLFQLL